MMIGLFGLILLVIAGLVLYIQTSWDKTYEIPYPNLSTSTDSAVIARGQYLVHGPAHCSNCHVSDFDSFIKADAGEPVPLQGGVQFPIGPLGYVYTANLTPDPETGIGRYRDEEIFRMMRHAVKPDGTASIAMMMPFWNMADDDLVAIVSYLRSMEPVKNKVSAPSYSFLGKAIRALTPVMDPVYQPQPQSKAPPMEATIERGEYISRYVANCVGCHTPRDPATFEAIGPEYSGGMEMEPLPELHKKLGVSTELWTRSPNITPAPGSALSKFATIEAWKTRFRQGRQVPISPMHWGPYSRMSDEDLEALYLYLSSLEPVENDLGPVVFTKE